MMHQPAIPSIGDIAVARSDVALEVLILGHDIERILARVKGYAPAALAACALHQAFRDAMWVEEPLLPGHRRRGPYYDRVQARLDAIEFWAGVVDPTADDDVGIGPDDELLTLERLCDLADLDASALRRAAIDRILTRSPLHADLLHSALDRARGHRTQLNSI